MKTEFQGFGENVATFEAAANVKAGLPVKVSGNGAVDACGAGDLFCGMAVSVRGGMAAVQLSGYVRAPYTGALAVGYQKLAAAADGKIQQSESGRELLVIDVDSAASICGIQL